MTPRFSGHFSIFGLVFFVLKSPLGIARQCSGKKISVLTLKPRSQVRILIYRTCAIINWLQKNFIQGFFRRFFQKRKGTDGTKVAKNRK